MSTLKTHNLQSPDAGSVNIAMTPNAGMVVTGISTFTGAIDANGDLDVDGHTNLDNVSISGITTFSDRAYLAHDLTITGTAPRVIFTDTNNNSDYRINVDAGNFEVQDVTNSYATRFRIKSDGNVGINDTDPSYKLNVIGDNAAYNGIGMLKGIIGVQNDTTAFGSSPTAGISFQTKYRTGPDVPLDVAAIWGGKENSTNGDKDGYMGFATREEGGSGSQERMRITSSGLLQLNNDSAKIQLGASQDLSIYHDGSSNRIIAANADLILQSNNYNIRSENGSSTYLNIDSSGRVIIGGTSPLTDAQLTLSDDDAPALAFQRSGSGKFESAIGMETNSALRFYVGADSSTVSGLTEVMQIDASGNLRLGTGAIGNTNIKGSSGTGNEGVYLAPGNTAQFAVSNGSVMALNRKTSEGRVFEVRYNGSVRGYFDTNGSSLPSDKNYKTNISDLSLGLSFVNKLKPSQFRFKDSESTSPILYGLIAQDVEESLTSEGVSQNSTQMLQYKVIADDDNESDYYLDYGKLTPVLINAVKELSTEIDKLKAEIAALKSS